MAGPRVSPGVWNSRNVRNPGGVELIGWNSQKKISQHSSIVQSMELPTPDSLLPTLSSRLPTAPLLLRPQSVIQFQLINNFINNLNGGPELLQPAEIIHPEYRRLKKFMLHRDGDVNVGVHKGY